MTSFKLRNELPIKYALGVHHTVPSYPTHQDVLFDIISYLVRVAEQKDKDWDSNDIKFSTKTLKYVFGDNMKSEEFVDRIKGILRELIDGGTLEVKGEFIFISNETFSQYYSIS